MEGFGFSNIFNVSQKIRFGRFDKGRRQEFEVAHSKSVFCYSINFVSVLCKDYYH